jgi:hypothetical protein
MLWGDLAQLESHQLLSLLFREFVLYQEAFRLER